MAKNLMSWVPVLGSIFALSGAAMLIAAGRQYIRRRAFHRSSVTARGIVVALTENPDRDEVSYFPKVKFRTPAGREVTFQSEMGSSCAAKQIGDTVSVRYRPDQPDVAEIDAFMPLWGLILLVGGLGIVFLLVGLGILVGALPV